MRAAVLCVACLLAVGPLSEALPQPLSKAAAAAAGGGDLHSLDEVAKRPTGLRDMGAVDVGEVQEPASEEQTVEMSATEEEEAKTPAPAPFNDVQRTDKDGNHIEEARNLIGKKPVAKEAGCYTIKVTTIRPVNSFKIFSAQSWNNVPCSTEKGASCQMEVCVASRPAELRMCFKSDSQACDASQEALGSNDNDKPWAGKIEVFTNNKGRPTKELYNVNELEANAYTWAYHTVPFPLAGAPETQPANMDAGNENKPRDTEPAATNPDPDVQHDSEPEATGLEGKAKPLYKIKQVKDQTKKSSEEGGKENGKDAENTQEQPTHEGPENEVPNAEAPGQMMTKDTTKVPPMTTELQRKVDRVFIAAGHGHVVDKSSEEGSKEFQKLNHGDPMVHDKIDGIMVANGHPELAGDKFRPPVPPTTAPTPIPQYVKDKNDNFKASSGDPEASRSASGSAAPAKVQLYNTKGGIAQYESEHETASGEIWREYLSPDGKARFWRNPKNGAVSWDAPPDGVGIELDNNGTTTFTQEGADDFDGNGTAPQGKKPVPGGGKNSDEKWQTTNNNTYTEVYKEFPFSSSKCVKRCCKGVTAEGDSIIDYLVLDPTNTEEGAPFTATKEECENKCRGTSFCNFFAVNSENECTGFSACSQQCDDCESKFSQTIYKIGQKPEKSGLPEPQSEWNRQEGVACTGAKGILKTLEGQPPGINATANNTAKECQEKCDTFGDECTGFSFPKEGESKWVCTFASGAVNSTANTTSDCFVKKPKAFTYEQMEATTCGGSPLKNGLMVSQAMAQSQCIKNGDCKGYQVVGSDFVMLYGGDIDKTRDARDDKFCFKKVANPALEAYNAGKAVQFPALTVSGTVDLAGQGSLNGVFKKSGEHNKKPMYTSPAGAIIRWESFAQNEEGAKNYGNQDTWVLVSKAGDYGYVCAGERDMPPIDGWSPVAGAKGKIQITSGADADEEKQPQSDPTYVQRPQRAPVVVSGGVGTCGQNADGTYIAYDTDTITGKNVYKNKNGLTLKFVKELAGSKWVISAGTEMYYIDSSEDLPPAVGTWKVSTLSQDCASGSIKVIEGKPGEEENEAPREVVVSGASGGIPKADGSTDNGGLMCNGKYTKESELHNGKPLYKNGHGCVMKFDSVSAGDWSAENLASAPSDMWLLQCGPEGSVHTRFFHTSDDNMPPQSCWVPRASAAVGSLLVTSGQQKPEPVTVSEATSFGAGFKDVDGTYQPHGYHNGKPKFKNSEGYTMRYEEAARDDWAAINLGNKDDVWVIGGNSKYLFFVISSSELPPLQGWTVASGTTAAKAPQGAALEVSEMECADPSVKLNNLTDSGFCPEGYEPMFPKDPKAECVENKGDSAAWSTPPLFASAATMEKCAKQCSDMGNEPQTRKHVCSAFEFSEEGGNGPTCVHIRECKQTQGDGKYKVCRRTDKVPEIPDRKVGTKGCHCSGDSELTGSKCMPSGHSNYCWVDSDSGCSDKKTGSKGLWSYKACRATPEVCECRADFPCQGSGAQNLCYVSSSSTCTDQKAGSQGPWSYKACQVSTKSGPHSAGTPGHSAKSNAICECKEPCAGSGNSNYCWVTPFSNCADQKAGSKGPWSYQACQIPVKKHQHCECHKTLGGCGPSGDKNYCYISPTSQCADQQAGAKGPWSYKVCQKDPTHCKCKEDSPCTGSGNVNYCYVDKFSVCSDQKAGSKGPWSTQACIKDDPSHCKCKADSPCAPSGGKHYCYVDGNSNCADQKAGSKGPWSYSACTAT